MNERVKRNKGQGTARRCTLTEDMFGGVGARHTPTPSPRRGGGYQNICTPSKFEPSAAQKKCDPRLDELHQMGLQRVWLEVAEEIGVDNMLKIWRILDSDQDSIGDDGRLLVPIRNYSTFLRFQRNSYIKTLVSNGLTPHEIKEKIERQLGEKLSMRHISRLSGRAKAH